MVERKGRVVAKATADIKGSTLLGLVREYVLPETTIFTDELNAYHGIGTMRTKDGGPMGYVHHRINHSSKVYVVGNVHTNTVEGFWSLIKRGIGGVYHSVSQKYLQSYLDEYSFRYNRREMGNQQFRAIVERVSERAT
ncbi:MAG: IS1595 family transposase [Candidatus Acidiferrales bacterium]